MALFDAKFELSDDQDLSQTTGTYASTNVIDWENNDLDIGGGNPMYLNIRMGTEALDSTGGTATLVVALASDEDATIDSSSRVVWQTEAFAEADLAIGADIISMSLPVRVDEDTVADGGNDGRYMGLLFTIGGETSTTGTIDAWIDNAALVNNKSAQVAESNI